jgi:hypothetical protein
MRSVLTALLTTGASLGTAEPRPTYSDTITVTVTY